MYSCYNRVNSIKGVNFKADRTTRCGDNLWPFEIFEMRGRSSVGRSSIYTYFHWSHIGYSSSLR